MVLPYTIDGLTVRRIEKIALMGCAVRGIEKILAFGAYLPHTE
jgi:hypothetical protein